MRGKLYWCCHNRIYVGIRPPVSCLGTVVLASARSICYLDVYTWQWLRFFLRSSVFLISMVLTVCLSTLKIFPATHILRTVQEVSVGPWQTRVSPCNGIMRVVVGTFRKMIY